MASSLTKTIQTALAAPQSLASNTVFTSGVQSVTTAFAAAVLIHFGRRADTALSASAIIRVEGSAKSSGDGHWWTLASWNTKIAAVTSRAVNGTCASGQNVVAMTATAGMTVGDIVYIDNGTIANSEWHRIKVVTTNTSITLEDNLVNAQTGATVYPAGEFFLAQVDLSAITRLRVVVNGSGTGQAVALEIEVITLDSIG